jgi:hypothetical protein
LLCRDGVFPQHIITTLLNYCRHFLPQPHLNVAYVDRKHSRSLHLGGGGCTKAIVVRPPQISPNRGASLRTIPSSPLYNTRRTPNQPDRSSAEPNVLIRRTAVGVCRFARIHLYGTCVARRDSATVMPSMPTLKQVPCHISSSTSIRLKTWTARTFRNYLISHHSI